MRRFLCIPMAIVAGLAAAAGAAALTPVSQDRHVHASNLSETLEGTFFFEETESAPDLGPFSAAIDGLPPPFSSPPIAIHDSSIGSEGLQATGTAIASPDEVLFANHTQESESVYHVDFDLSQARNFTLNGQLDLEAHACEVSTRGYIRLTGPGGVVAEVQDEILTFPSNFVHCDPPCVVSLPLLAGGFLPSGSYTLEAVVDSDGLGRIIPSDPCENVFATSSFSVDLLLSDPEVPALPGPAVALAGFIVGVVARRSLRARASRQSAATSASPNS